MVVLHCCVSLPEGNIHLITKHHEISPQVAAIHQFAAHCGDWHTEQREEFADRVDCGVEHLVWSRSQQIVEPIFPCNFLCMENLMEISNWKHLDSKQRFLALFFLLFVWFHRYPSASVQSSPQQMWPDSCRDWISYLAVGEWWQGGSCTGSRWTFKDAENRIEKLLGMKLCSVYIPSPNVEFTRPENSHSFRKGTILKGTSSFQPWKIDGS